MLLLSVCVCAAAVLFTGSVFSQGRDRVVKTTSSQPVNQPPVIVVGQPDRPKTQSAARPTLTNDVVVVKNDPAYEPLVKRTGSSRPMNSPAAMAAAGRTAYGSSTSIKIDQAIKARYGLPYRYGSTGPNSYDCSGFVWSVFGEAGIHFTRASARTLWAQSEPVYGDDRFKYGTLVFFNNLGHMGIVADENGFYQASSSKGITYSPFAGYWQSRIVGYRRLKPEYQTVEK
jgi:cell wall-associated NlpC family hydrolase